MSDIRPDGYTDDEFYALIQLMDELMDEFQRGGDWETILIRAHAIVMRKQANAALPINWDVAKAEPDPDFEPVWPKSDWLTNISEYIDGPDIPGPLLPLRKAEN